MTKRMQREMKSIQQGITIVILLCIVLAVVSACRPDTDSLEIAIAATTKTERPPLTASTPQASPTMTKTTQPTATKTLASTATATATPVLTPTQEAVELKSNEQLAIEAAETAGINVFDLKNSSNSYVSEHPGIDYVQRGFENSFGNINGTRVEMINVGLELNQEFIEIEKFRSTTTLTGEEFEKELTSRIEAALAKIPQTNSGWQHIVYSKDIINVPEAEKVINPRLVLAHLMSYNANTGELWIKRPNDSTYIVKEGLSRLMTSHLYGNTLERSLVYAHEKEGYFLGPGAVFSLNATFPSDDYQNNGGLTLKDELPNYSEEELAYFRETGDTSIFGYEYEDKNGVRLPILWPWIKLVTTMTPLDN